MTLGEKLKIARKQAGLSQEQLSEKLGVSRSAVAKWETDNGIPDVDNLKTLSRLLNVSIDYMLDNGEAIERAIAGSHGFELCRDRSLQRNPKGFPAGNRYDEWLRLLDFGIMKPLDERTILAPDLLVRVLDDFRSTAPLVAILNRAVRYAYEEMM